MLFLDALLLRTDAEASISLYLFLLDGFPCYEFCYRPSPAIELILLPNCSLLNLHSKSVIAGGAVTNGWVVSISRYRISSNSYHGYKKWVFLSE